MQPSGHRRRSVATRPPLGGSGLELFPDLPALAGFVPLPENRSALAAFQELGRCLLANQSDQAVNPLYLHGPAGVGKSCLVAALVEEVAPGVNARVLSANAFPLPWDQDEASAAQERYDEARRCDLLAIEDLQHLPARMTEAVVQLLDERLQRRLPTICTAAAGPALLAHRGSLLPTRLTSRFAAGLVVALPPPPAASRRLLLQELARRRGLDLAHPVLDWLADTLTGGGRQLEGALNEIAALQKLGPLTLDELQTHFQVQADAGRPTVERIVHRVSAYFRVEPRQLQSARRHRSLLMPRHVSMYLARRLTRLSLEQIGAYFGGRDHSTVLHACRKVENAIKSDATLSGAVGAIHAELA